MKKPTKAIAVLAVSLLPLFAFSHLCYAETVVHLDRNHGARASQPQTKAASEQETAQEPDSQEPVEETVAAENAQQDSTNKQQTIQEPKLQEKETLPKKQESPDLENNNNSTQLTTKLTNNNSSPSEISTICPINIFIDNTSKTFFLDPPQISKMRLDNFVMIASTFTARDENGKKSAILKFEKCRNVDSIGIVDNYYNLVFGGTLFSSYTATKKHPPRLMITTKKEIIYRNFKRPDYWETELDLTGFYKIDGKKIQNFLSDENEITFQMITTHKDYTCIPIPKDVIKQWLQVALTDMIELKHQYDE